MKKHLHPADVELIRSGASSILTTSGGGPTPGSNEGPISGHAFEPSPDAPLAE